MRSRSLVYVHDTATTEIYTLSLHDALPISLGQRERPELRAHRVALTRFLHSDLPRRPRSEEHTSELQSRFDLVCRLLLEKKNTRRTSIRTARPSTAGSTPCPLATRFSR